jgi:hypothetical protein
MTLIRRLLRAVLLAASLAASAGASATTVSINYSDMWGTASEPGWGLTISQQANILLGTLFIYDQGELARWYTVTLLPDSISPSGSVKYSGTLFETSGPPFSQPFNPALVEFRSVGQLSIEFGDASHALLNYTIDGAGAVKQVTRFTFAANPIVGSYLGATSDITFDCTDPARNGLVTNDTGLFTITQDASGVTMKFPTCTVTDGVYAQSGQISSVDAIYNCPGGAVGEIKFNVLQSEQGGIVGTYTGRDKSCKFRGNIGGARIAK